MPRNRLHSTWCIVLVCLAPLHALPSQAFAQEVVPHERPPVGPWIPTPRGGASVAGSCQSHVVRDSYRSIQVNVDERGCNVGGDAANEPSIAVDLTDPRKMVIGWRQFDSVQSDFRQPGWAYSHDGGHTWVFRGSLDPGVFGSDPVLAAGPDGEIYYLSINSDEMRLFKSLDGGITWPRPTQISPFFLDKPWMALDTTNGGGRGNVYLSADHHLFRGPVQGEDFEFTDDEIAPYWPSLSVGPDGTLYAFGRWGTFASCINAQYFDQEPGCEYMSFGSEFTMLFGDLDSPNGGLLGMNWVATDHSPGTTHGNVYVLGNVYVSRDDYVDLLFRASMDGGTTWTDGVRVHDDPIGSGAFQWFGMMSVAPNGRIDVVWNDTRNFLDAPSANLSEVYYTCSEDAGVSWSKNTPVSSVFDSHVGWPSGQTKIGDYYHMVSDNLGVNVAYAATFNGEQDIYFLRIGPWDCNGNQIDDALDISELRSRDCNANEVPDECEYRADFNGDGLTKSDDFATFQLNLTGPGVPVPNDCTRLLDPDHDGDVDLHDYYLLTHVFTAP